jgi:betaine reductase
MPEAAVIRAASLVLAHTPSLARHGSKPMRTLAGDAELARNFLANLRTFDNAVGYPAHQAFLGVCHPRELPPRPWLEASMPGAERFAPFGELMPEDEFLGLMAAVDEFDLLVLTPEVAERAAKRLAEHPLAAQLDLARVSAAAGNVDAGASGALPVHLAPHCLAGALRGAHAEDEALAAHVLLENLACKATGTLALLHLLHDNGVDPAAIGYTISCSEEAVGDRYQRGGGNMGKTIAAVAGLTESSGADVKNFCAAPIPALVIAASLVVAGVFEHVVVLAGGSLPKLGMKFEGHLRHGLPVLEDVLGGVAVLVTADDGISPRIRLDAVGHTGCPRAAPARRSCTTWRCGHWKRSAPGCATSTTTPPSCTTRRSPNRRAPETSRHATTARSRRSPPAARRSPATRSTLSSRSVVCRATLPLRVTLRQRCVTCPMPSPG